MLNELFWFVVLDWTGRSPAGARTGRSGVPRHTMVTKWTILSHISDRLPLTLADHFEHGIPLIVALVVHRRSRPAEKGFVDSASVGLHTSHAQPEQFTAGPSARHGQPALFGCSSSASFFFSQWIRFINIGHEFLFQGLWSNFRTSVTGRGLRCPGQHPQGIDRVLLSGPFHLPNFWASCFCFLGAS